MLEAIEAILEGRIVSDVESYQIAGRQITKIPVTELLELRKQYKSEISIEEAKQAVKLGTGNPFKIQTRFNN
ncbi:MAG: hypothetical protein GY797_26445 [Deltaproteobacteria bacterium]|nr:hypothetical protein [Deltaproteobacteria bacterium]